MYNLVIFNVLGSFLSPTYRSFRPVMKRQGGTCFTCVEVHNWNPIMDRKVEQHLTTYSHKNLCRSVSGKSSFNVLRASALRGSICL